MAIDPTLAGMVVVSYYKAAPTAAAELGSTATTPMRGLPSDEALQRSLMLLITIAILFLGSLALWLLDRFEIRIGYSWFLAVGIGLAAWILVLVAYHAEPQTFPLMDWSSSGLGIGSPELVLDAVSWPYVLAIATLLLAVVLTDVARVQEIHAGSWAAGMALAGTGILAVAAANPLTLLLGWAFIDLSETTVLMQAVTNSQQRERVVIAFFVRILGLLLVVAAILRAMSNGQVLQFDTISLVGASYLILATGLRLGVIPPHPPFFQESPSRRGLATLVRLVPVAASLVLLNRVASTGVAPVWVLPLMITTTWAVAYGVIAWFSAPNELDGRPFWILGFSAFSVAAAIQSQPLASQAWGVATLFSGGVLFLYSSRSRKIMALPLLGLVGISALPFTPAWRGSDLFTALQPLVAVFYILGLVLLLAGYFRHVVRVDLTQVDIERWAWLVYPAGLALLPISHWFVAWRESWLTLPGGGFDIFVWVSGGLAALLGGLVWLYRKGLARRVAWISRPLRIASSLNWFYAAIWWLYRTVSRLVIYLGQILEGEGGVLWAVLLIILLVLVISRPGMGG